ncbi:retrovirus-related pol polyprotein from transposon TNT 1-94 [Tanacetum coccineum]
MSYSSSVSKGFQPKFTPKLIQSSQHAQSNQGEPKSSKPFESKNKGLVAETFDWDEGKVSDDEEETQVKVLIAIADDELYVGKNHARNGEWIDITMKKLGSEPQTPIPPLINLQGASLTSEVMTLTYQDHSPRERSGLGTLKYTKPETQESSNKNVSGSVTISDTKLVNYSVPIKVKTNDQESKIDELTKLVQMLRDEKINSTQKIQELKSVSSQPELSKPVNSSKQSQDSKPNGKNPDSSKSVRGGTLAESSQSSESFIGVSCKTCGSSVHSTTNHNDFDHFKRDEKLQDSKAKEPTKRMVENQNEVKARQIRTDNGTEFRNSKLESFCNEKGISHNFSSPYTSKQNGVAERKNRTLIEVARTICLVFIHNYKDHRGKFDAKADDGYFLGYSFNSKAFRVFKTRRQQIEKTYHVTFDESIEAIRFTNTLVDKIGINDSSKYPLDKFTQEDDPSRQYQANSEFTYYINPHGRSLTELTQEHHVPEVIALNEQDNPHTEDAEGPPDLINTKGTHKQNVQYEQINQPTKETSGNNTKNSAPITEPLIPEDRWSRDQHIELVNIIGDPSEGMLTRSMAAKLTAASASECLFVDLLSKIEPKKPFKWVFKNKKDEHGIVTENKARLVAQSNSQEEGIFYDETFAPVASKEAIMIFLTFSTYMNFIVFQMDVKSAFLNGKLKEEVYVRHPPGFESSEFHDYVCMLDNALYGLKLEPRAWLIEFNELGL